MDVVGAIRNLNLFDLLVAFFVFGFFVAGFIQGTVRRLIGLGILVVAILLAINLRDPFGSWLAGYWVQFPKAYSTMLAFGASFIVIYLAGSILVQVFYRRTTLFKRSTLADEVIGTTSTGRTIRPRPRSSSATRSSRPSSRCSPGSLPRPSATSSADGRAFEGQGARAGLAAGPGRAPRRTHPSRRPWPARRPAGP